MKKIIQFILIYSMLPYVIYAQNSIRGTVKDEQGALPGVSIIEKGMKGNGTVTNERGEFQLQLKGSSHTLVISSIGYITQEVNVTGKTVITVNLKTDAKGLDEVVVVGYGTTKKITNTGATSSISAAEIRTTPTPNVQNTLAGRVPGFISQQRSGQPGQSGADFYIRGVNSLNSAAQKPLIIVDDVEYTYDQVAQLDVNEIETFTVLKDASSTAVYGVKGANGVLIITTRRGKLGKPKINFVTESGLQEPFKKYHYLNAFQVASLYNEANYNDNPDAALPFTYEDLEHWRKGDDPYGHPDVDWYNVIFKNRAYQTRNNIDLSGGSERVKYFVSAGYVFQNGMLHNFSKGTGQPDNNYAYQRYNFRSNLDMQATKDLSLRLDVTGRLGTTTEPHITTAPLSTVNSYQRLPPYAMPLINPDGSYPYAFRSRYLEPSLVGRLALQGYDRTYRNEFNILLGGTHKLDFITKGLSIKGRVAFASDVRYVRSLSRAEGHIPAFYYDPVNNTYTQHSNQLYTLEPLTLSGGAADNVSLKTINTQAILDYDRTFDNTHHVYGLVLYNRNQYTTGQKSLEVAPNSFRGYSFRFGYDYKRRYLIEFDGAYNGSDRFVSKNRYGWFPAVSAGWNISEEPFFKKAVKFVDLLKLRGSFGLVGSDVVANDTYKYEQVYETGSSTTDYSFGESHNNAPTIQEGDLGNLDITWEKSRKTDIGLDAQLFNGQLSFGIDYFYDLRYDQLISRRSVLDIIGIGLPLVNLGRTENKGWDGQIAYNKNKGDFTYSAAFTFSFAKNKILYIDEAAARYPWLAETGRPIGQATGYNVLGFFQSQDEVDNYAHVANAKPGDLKYEDKNGDGVIDQLDQVPIGKPNLPQTVLGTSLGAGYKGFSINVLLQGSFNYSFRIASAGIIPFQGNLQPVHLGRWTPETAATATYPRLSAVLSGPSSPNTSSNFWLIDAKYLRLKSVDIGYMLPKKWVNHLGISSARLYLSGYDLATWSNFSLYQQDPEITSSGSAGTYPVQKVYNLGLQVGF
ncbi:TonB-dependent receptor [Pedobacter sp. BS3]|uniref:SusC/RagA family TonB-linked outer membrane protein n=1 Tax=Pedobacter sp. BS3 TaxID=2567937 RepID=UPI0011F04504|nr:TonB-dependent receptor [Pedobacter sp. BS3]TZF82787.1 TonB-dependent receptor [Pedobacter sp. BS3]